MVLVGMGVIGCGHCGDGVIGCGPCGDKVIGCGPCGDGGNRVLSLWGWGNRLWSL